MGAPKDPVKYKEWKINSANGHKGLTPWNKGLTKDTSEIVKKMYEKQIGRIPWNKGIKMPEEMKKNMGKSLGKKYPADIYPTYSMRNKKHSEETKIKMSESHSGIKHPMYGKKHTEESKIKMSESHKGCLAWNKGKKKLQFHSEDTKKKMSLKRQLEKHPNWLGGKSFEPYGLDFNSRFKESIRERDNYCCIICNRPQEELPELLSVHHIDYNKKNSFPQNCVSLCRYDHIRTNINRNHWKTFFQSLLKERYKYEYTEDQKIILDFMEG